MMNAKGQDVVSIVSNGVTRALLLFRSEKLDESMQLIAALQNDFANQTAFDPTREFHLRRHLLLWVMLQNGAMLFEQSELDEAHAIFEWIRESTIDFGIAEFGNELECFCLEYSTATFELAKIVAAMGDLTQSIQILTELYFDLRRFHDLQDQVSISYLIAQVDLMGTYLGYDQVSGALGVQSKFNNRPLGLESSKDHWRFPFPMLGEEYQALMNETFEAIRDFAHVPDDDLITRHCKSEEVCSTIERWLSDYEFSVPIGVMHLQFLAAKAEYEIKLNETAHFRSSMRSFSSLLERMANDHSENLFLLLKASRWTTSIARTLLFSESEEGEGFQERYAIAVNCLATSQNLLEAIKVQSAVDQAVALRECLVTNLAALSRDFASSMDEALTFRRRRDCILGEILARDPQNDLGLRLWSEYQETQTARDPSVQQEIANWNWKIVPLSTN